MNKRSPAFPAPYKVDLPIMVKDDWMDEPDLLAAERWCAENTRHKWFRRVWIGRGRVRFEFQDLQEATMFRLAH